jgi:hypothetical protein
MLEVSGKKPTEFWKIYDNLKENNKQDYSNDIAPQEWYNYFSKVRGKYLTLISN